MTRALLHARHIAETCNGLECAAPEPVDGGYLDRALARMRLPITVRTFDNEISGTGIVIQARGKTLATLDPAQATRIYFEMYESIGRATSSPGTELADGCSATSAPEGGL